MDINIALNIFELSYNYTIDDVRKKYKKLCLKYHPDKNINNPYYNPESFNKIKEAHDCLINNINNKNNKKIYNFSILDNIIYIFLNFIYIFNKQKVIQNKTTINNIINKDLMEYYIDNSKVYIPLWIDNITIKTKNKNYIFRNKLCVPKYIEIDNNKNIYIFNYKKHNTKCKNIKILNKGFPINQKTIYDIRNKTNVYIYN